MTPVLFAMNIHLHWCEQQKTTTAGNVWGKRLTGNVLNHNAAEGKSINKDSVDSEVDEGEARASCSAGWQGPGKRPDPPP